VSQLARAWAAVLYAGPGAALGGSTTLWLWGLLPNPPELVTVCVPAGRRVRPQPRLRCSQRSGLADALHPAVCPPRLRMEHALLDVTAGHTAPAPTLDLVIRAIQNRLTTAQRLRQALVGRPRHPARRLLVELLAEVQGGAQSALERR
jgi:hypothetical protein